MQLPLRLDAAISPCLKAMSYLDVSSARVLGTERFTGWASSINTPCSSELLFRFHVPLLNLELETCRIRNRCIIHTICEQYRAKGHVCGVEHHNT